MEPIKWIAPLCPLCSAADKAPVLEAHEGGDSSRPRFQVVRCRRCDHHFTCPRPADEDLGSLYPGAYHHELSGPSPRSKTEPARSVLCDHFGYPPGPGSFLRCLRGWPSALRWRRRRPLLDVLPWVGQGRLLDYGCGGCAFLLRQRSRGWSVAGIELSEDAAELGRSQGLEVEVGAWPGPAFEGRRFDVITAWHVLEHAPEPRAWVQHAAQALAPGGLLIICCPVRDAWARSIFREDWVGWELPRHLSHFSRAELRALPGDAGLMVIGEREQARSATLRASAKRRGAHAASFWAWLARRRPLWSGLAALSGWMRRSDGAIVVARKPR